MNEKNDSRLLKHSPVIGQTLQTPLSIYSSYLIKRKKWSQLIKLIDRMYLSQPRKTALLIGNCQVAPITSIIEINDSFHTDFKIIKLLPDIHEMPLELQNLVYEYILPKVDILISQNIVNKKYPLNTEKCKDLCRTIVFPTCFFAGYYPDIIYLKRNDQTIRRSPLVDYHSAFILQSFSEGLNENACIAALQDGSWIGENYLGQIQNIFDALADREKAWDIKITDYLYSNFKQKILFYTVNHPSTVLLALIANNILSYLGFDQIPLEKRNLIPEFLDRTKWIVNQKVASQIGIDPNTQSDFLIDGVSLSVEEFVGRHYRYYDENQDLVTENIDRCREQIGTWNV